jgi:hypothetical protein
MGKRSEFIRVERDFYPTPLAAVIPLLPHLQANTNFIEPCGGDGRLIEHLEKYGHKCTFASDIEPLKENIQKLDAMTLTWENVNHADCIITNPPWDRKLLHPMIEHFSSLAPTLLLFDGDWAHTVQSAKLIKKCQKIIAIGRVKWIEGSKFTGKENACWYLFGKHQCETQFIGRSPKGN